ncbi:hypothetical protein BD626DRAFT_537325 [Schizophyllum amplum]|uniref:Uncharacterized protein n=1 Tax=Schizophyllum amplum TaxID=97359 RepID=A0A550CDT3_9AGAR|nr:hypothetical protein BD626DRAFT_537325 [Auriculariopsis ampla]
MRKACNAFIGLASWFLPSNTSDMDEHPWERSDVRAAQPSDPPFLCAGQPLQSRYLLSAARPDHQQGTVETSDNSLFLILDARSAISTMRVSTGYLARHCGEYRIRRDAVCSAVTHWNLADGDRTMQAFHRNMIELLCLDIDDPEESRRSTVDVTSSPRERTIAANEMEASHQLSNCLPNRGARAARRRALVQDAPTSGARVLLVPADGFSTTTSSGPFRRVLEIGEREPMALSAAVHLSRVQLFDARSAQDEVQASPGCVFDGSWAAKAAAPAATV